MPLAEIKNFNVLIDSKPFFDQLAKAKEESYKKLIKMSRNDDYTTGKVWDYFYYWKYFKVIGIDLSRQANASIANKLILWEK